MSVIEAQKILLAHVAKADGIIHPAEVNTAIAMAASCDGLSKENTKTVLTQLKYLEKAAVEEASELLSPMPRRERERIVQLLWVMAMCDGELHPKEEAVIYQLADALGIDRATVAAGQPNL